MDHPFSHPDATVTQLARTDRLQLLFRQSLTAVYGSFLGAVMLCWLCWDYIEHNVALSWIGVLSVATLSRIVLFTAYYRSPETSHTPSRWERRYWVTLVFSAGVWGLGALAVMPHDSLLAQAIVLLFAVGMSGSAVSCYYAYRSMTLAAIGLVLLPCTLWLLFQPSQLQTGMALAVLVFSSFMLRATGKLCAALEKALCLTHEMERAHHIASSAAQTDELTGLKNRRAFFEHAQQLYSHSQREQRPLCALMLDIDHFKRINDTYGHQVGDEVLRQIGGVIKASFRDTDVYGRLGGEEFAVLLADTPMDTALGIAEQLAQAIAQLQFVHHSDGRQGMTASFGVAVASAAHSDLHTLLNSADQAMYRAKAQGRNQVVAAD